jgi:excisionase family DNA binding protein
MARDGGLRSGHARAAGKQALACGNEGAASLPTMLSTREAAKYWRVTKDKVLGWIRAGFLEAIDVRSSQSSRPQYRIPRAAVEAFNASRGKVAWAGERKDERLSRRASKPSRKAEGPFKQWF